MDSSRKLPGNFQETAKIANHYVPPLVIRLYSTGLLFIRETVVSGSGTQVLLVIR